MNEYFQHFPFMSDLPGNGSAVVQNLAGLPSGISGNVLPEQNAVAKFGPSGFYIPLLSDVAREVEAQNASTAGQVAAAVTAPVDFFQTQAGQIAKRLGWSLFAYGLVLIGLTFLLWRPVVRPAVETAVKAAT